MLKNTLRVLLLITVLLICLILVLTTVPGEKILLAGLDKFVLQSLPVHIKVEKLETNLFNRLQFESVTVQFEDSSQVISVQIPRLKITGLLGHYFRKGVFIDSLLIKKPIVDIILLGNQVREDSEGEFEFPVPENLGLQGLSLVIQQGSFGLKDSMQDLIFRSGDIHASGNISSSAYQVKIQTGVSTLQSSGLQLESVKLRMTALADSRGIQLQGGNIQTPGLQADLNIRMAGWTSAASLIGDISTDMDLSLVQQSWSPYLPTGYSSLRGHLRNDVSISGSVNSPLLKMKSIFQNVEINDYISIQGSMDASLADYRLSLDSLNIEALDGKIEGSGSLDLDKLSMESDLNLTHLDIFELWSILKPTETSPFEGRLSGKLQTSGSLHDLTATEIHGDFRLTEVAYDSRKIAPGNLMMNLHDGQFMADYRQDNAYLNCSGIADEKSIRADCSFSLPNITPLAVWFDYPKLSGALIGTVNFQKMDTLFQVQSDLTGKHLAYDAMRADSVYATVQYDQAGFTIHNLELGGSVPLEISAEENPGQPGDNLFYQASIKGKPDSLEMAVTYQFSGSVHPILNNVQGEVKAKFDGDRLEVSKHFLCNDHLCLESTGNYSTMNSSAELDLFFYFDTLNSVMPENGSFLQDDHSGQIQLQFIKAADQTWSADGTVSELDLKALSSQFLTDSPVTGIADGNFSLSGLPGIPAGQFQLSVQNGLLSPLESTKFSGTLKDRLLTVSEFAASGSAIELNGHGEMGPFPSDLNAAEILQTPTKGLFSLRIPDLTPLNAVMPEGSLMIGQATADIQWAGSPSLPSLFGTILLSDASYSNASIPYPVSGIQGEFSFQDSLLIIEKFSGTYSDQRWKVNGRMTLAGRESILTDFSIRLGDLPAVTVSGRQTIDSMYYTLDVKDMALTILEPFLPGLSPIAGSVDSKIIVNGSPGDPEINGYIHVDQFGCKLPNVREPLSNGHLELNFTRNEVKLDTVFVSVGKGRITGSGSGSWKSVASLSLTMRTRMHKVPIDQPGSYHLMVDSGTLILSNNLNHWNLSGDMVFGDSQIVEKLQGGKVIRLLERINRPSTPPPDWMKKVHMDVRLRTSERFWIDNNIARLKVPADLVLGGTFFQPALTGRASASEGYILYLDRKFKIQRAHIDFIDPFGIKPELDLAAETKLKSFQTLSRKAYDITLTVAGPAAKPTVTLLSVPPVSQPDIVSLLTLGATRAELGLSSSNESDNTFMAAMKDRLSLMTSQYISTSLTGRVGGWLGLKDLTLEGNLFERGDAWGPELMASRALSDRIELTYSARIGHANDQAIRLDYKLTEQLFIEGQADQEGNTGLDLKLKYEFK